MVLHNACHRNVAFEIFHLVYSKLSTLNLLLFLFEDLVHSMKMTFLRIQMIIFLTSQIMMSFLMVVDRVSVTSIHLLKILCINNKGKSERDVISFEIGLDRLGLK